MAQILCKKSGILFDCQYMPVSLHSRELSHPIFTLSQKKLLSLVPRCAAGETPEAQAYLIFLALLDSTSLIEWRTSAVFTAETTALIASNLESLSILIGKINLVKNTRFHQAMPRVIITHDTASLAGLPNWIEIWNDSYKDWNAAQKDYEARLLHEEKVSRREAALTKLIRSAYATNPAKMGAALADWAAVAGTFPTYATLHPITNQQISLADYWRQIIRSAHDEDKLWRFPKKDIQELLDHCEDNITNGSIRSVALFKLLKRGVEQYDVYLGIANYPTTRGSTSFSIISEDNSTLNATVTALTQNAPTEEPKQESYATKIAYMRARAQWSLAQAKAKGHI